MNYYTLALKKYAVFEGRATRPEYWYFFLWQIIISIGLGFIEGLSGYAAQSNESVLANIYYLATVIPAIAVGVRRLHDIDKSGWYLLIPIYNLFLLAREGQNGSNQYGPSSIVGSSTQFVSAGQYTKNIAKCSKCRANIPAGIHFCKNCGMKVS